MQRLFQIQFKLFVFLSALFSIFRDQLLDLRGRINDVVQTLVMIDGVDNGSGEFGHIRLQVPVAGQQLRGTVIQVGGDDVVEIAAFVIFIKFLKAVCEQSEGTADDDLVRSAFFPVTSAPRNSWATMGFLPFTTVE